MAKRVRTQTTETAQMALRPILALAAAAGLTGCGSFPQLEATTEDTTSKSAYPALVPVEDLRAVAAARQPSAEATTLVAGATQATSPAPEIDARAARLKARAASLRGEVIDTEAKERLEQPIEIEDEDI